MIWAVERDAYEDLVRECEARGLPVSAAALARHERANGGMVASAESAFLAYRYRRALEEIVAEEAAVMYDDGGGEPVCQYCSAKVIARGALADPPRPPMGPFP